MAVPISCNPRSQKCFCWYLLYETHHPICDVHILFGEVRVRHDVRIGCWTSPPHNTVIVVHQHHPLHSILLPLFWPILPDEGRMVDHTVNTICFSLWSWTEECSTCHQLFLCCFSWFLRFFNPPSGWRWLVRSFLYPWSKPDKTLSSILYY